MRFTWGRPDSRVSQGLAEESLNPWPAQDPPFCTSPWILENSSMPWMREGSRQPLAVCLPRSEPLFPAQKTITHWFLVRVPRDKKSPKAQDLEFGTFSIQGS